MVVSNVDNFVINSRLQMSKNSRSFLSCMTFCLNVILSIFNNLPVNQILHSNIINHITDRII